MRIIYEVVNPAPKQYLLECKLESNFIKFANYCPGINGIKKSKFPLRTFFPEFEEYGEINLRHCYQYVLNDNNEVYCYEADLTKYDRGEYERSPLSKAILVHKFNIARRS